MKTNISSTGIAYTVNKDRATCQIVGIGDFDGKELTVPEELDGYKVKSIAKEAFRGCASLVSAEICGGIESIGAEAFAGCEGLMRVKISDTVSEIGWGAFLDCASLEDISIGNGVTEIGAKAFCGCRGRANIPAKTVLIGEQAFCGFSDIRVDPDNKHYTSLDGCLYTKSGKTLLQYATGKETPSFTVPDTVTAIGSFAFSGAVRLSAVRFGEKLKTVGSNAFNGCTALWAANLPNSVETIEDSAFFGCTSLSAVSVAKDTDIGRGAFGNCPKLPCIRRRGKRPLWKKLLLGKIQKPDSSVCECKGEHWSIKFWF